MRITQLLLTAALVSVVSTGVCNEADVAEDLTLEQAIEMAERLHPRLAEARAMVEAASGRAEQAGAFPNPELIAGALQLPLDGDASNQREYVAGVAQPIPLGGRRNKAREAELLDREVRARGLEVTRQDLRKSVHGAFATALYQDGAFQTQKLITTSIERLAATAKLRVEAGDAIPEDLARVEMELAQARLEIQRSQLLREQAMVSLAAAIGEPGLNVRSLTGDLDATFEIPALTALAVTLSNHPAMFQAEAALRASQARIDLAKAERIPDVKVEVLYHRLEATEENTLDVGLSIPLPLFNRNQGRVRAAQAEAAAAEARVRTTQNELGAHLRESYGQLTVALANVQTLEDEILPRAQTVLKVAEARYEAGDTSLADLLPVRRDWAAVQLSHLEAIRGVMQAWAEVSSYLHLL